MKRSRFWLGLSVASLAVVAGFYGAASAGVRINTTPSAPRGIWLMANDHVPPARGTFVSICLPDEWAAFAAAREYVAPTGECPGQHEGLIKQVIAIPGDTVSIDDTGISVDGKRVPGSQALTEDEHKRPLRGVDAGTYEVRPNQIWVIGPGDSRSFDSRYFGPLPEESIHRTARPWLTF